MDLKKFVGKKIGPLTREVTATNIQDFVGSIGGKDRGEEAPPTFFTFFRNAEFYLMEKMDLRLSQVLHGEQEYDLFRPIVPGTEVIYTSELTNVVEKRGSKSSLSFLIFETQFFDKKTNDLLGVSKTSIIVPSKAEKEA